MTSDHLDIRSVWKSVVASCVRVAELRMHIFNVFVSSMKRVHLQRQSVHLQHKMGSSLAINACLQCDIVFGGE